MKPMPPETLMRASVDELRAAARLRFRLLPDRGALIADLAEAICQEVRGANARGEPARLILPVGPTAQYRQVAETSNRERLSWKNVWIFQMDEFLDWQGRPIPASHPLSFEGYLRRALLGALDGELRLPEGQFIRPHPFRIDEISERIASAGGVDCCFGGIGYHGHVAFNEPPLSRWRRVTVGELRSSLTRVVTLGSDSIVVQSIQSAGGDPEAIPPMAVTIGMRDILAARRIRLYCAGGERHRAVFRRAVAGEVCVQYPATLVQGHPDAEAVTEEATARPIQPSLD